MTTSNSITELRGVGEALAKKFASLGVHTIQDLLEYFPRRYEDYSQVIGFDQLRPGAVTVTAKIQDVSGRYVRRGMHITEAIAVDKKEHKVRLVWFNQPYRATALKRDEDYFISGNYELSRQRFAIMNPNVELMGEFPINTARIVPVYKEMKGLTSLQIRKVLRELFKTAKGIPETLPTWLVEQEGLLGYGAALKAIHFPQDNLQLESARRRFGFEEVFSLTLASILNKREMLQDATVTIPFQEKLARKFVSHLPFKLTSAQRAVIWQIYQDLERAQPMNRLVEGDVGSGKTVVAAMGALMPIAEGYQVAFMAPTELLARQHAETVYRLLEPLGMHDKIALLVGGMTPAAKEDIRNRIASGQAQVIIGTHALIQEKVDMHRLGLVIVDEQHRFGVEQRKKLMAKAGHMPHLLSLTATPIPRSLALTLYGELDISILKDKPAGRQPIITRIASPNSRAQLYAEIDRQLADGRQMFVVCPLITDSSATQASSVEKTYEDFAKHDFKHRRVGLLHGKMKAVEKNEVMGRFVRHELDILVSTTVIEVGVDVPNASVMLIESAERFGLAQAHQLRGRVGRGRHQGYCYLMMGDSGAPPKRLQALERSSDGFKLAELDLELRGPGAIYGSLQHGQLDLRVARLTDAHLIAAARSAAQKCVDQAEDLVQYEQLYDRIQRLRAVTNLN